MGIKAGAEAVTAARASRATGYSVFYETTIQELGAGTRASHFAQAKMPYEQSYVVMPVLLRLLES
jgi:hypothetical protein